MTWGRIDDTLYDHPKVVCLGKLRLPAIGLHVLALSWSNRYLTDGLVPADQVARLGGPRKLAEALVAAGLWELDRAGYRIHDYLDYNDSREVVLRRRNAEREKKRRQRALGAGAVGHDPDDGRFSSRGDAAGDDSPDSPVDSEPVSHEDATEDALGDSPGASSATRPLPASPGLSSSESLKDSSESRAQESLSSSTRENDLRAALGRMSEILGKRVRLPPASATARRLVEDLATFGGPAVLEAMSRVAEESTDLADAAQIVFRAHKLLAPIGSSAGMGSRAVPAPPPPPTRVEEVVDCAGEGCPYRGTLHAHRVPA